MAAVPAARRTILVVDDDPDVLGYASEILRGCDYTVVEAADGAAALCVLDCKAGVDLVFTDVVMPGIDGFELARRALLQMPTLKVLFASGYPADAPRGVRLLKKPYRPRQLASAVEAALRR